MHKTRKRRSATFPIFAGGSEIENVIDDLICLVSCLWNFLWFKNKHTPTARKEKGHCR